MKKLIEEQLKKVQFAKLDNFNKDTNTFCIKKIDTIKPEVDSIYIIRLDKSLMDIHASSILASNFNHGEVPTNEYMKVEINKIVGTMIYVNGIGFNPITRLTSTTIWCGWLPLNNIEILEKL